MALESLYRVIPFVVNSHWFSHEHFYGPVPGQSGIGLLQFGAQREYGILLWENCITDNVSQLVFLLDDGSSSRNFSVFSAEREKGDADPKFRERLRDETASAFSRHSSRAYRVLFVFHAERWEERYGHMEGIRVRDITELQDVVLRDGEYTKGEVDCLLEFIHPLSQCVGVRAARVA